MATIKISGLAAVVTPLATDLIEISQALASYKATAQQIVDVGLKAPGPVGGTTPNAGAFTALSAINNATTAGFGLSVLGNVAGGTIGDFRYPGTGTGGIAISGYSDGSKSITLSKQTDTVGRILVSDGTNTSRLDLVANGTCYFDRGIQTAGGLQIAVGSDADGDMWYRASNVFARLAKGAANTKLFMNAAGTAPEWATQFKVINTTRDTATATGNVAYTGAGFKPSMVIMLASTAGFHGSYSEGFYDGATYATKYTNEVPNSQISTSYVGVVGTAAGNTLITVASFDSDGITLTYTKTGAPTGTASISMLLFR